MATASQIGATGGTLTLLGGGGYAALQSTQEEVKETKYTPKPKSKGDNETVKALPQDTTSSVNKSQQLSPEPSKTITKLEVTKAVEPSTAASPIPPPALESKPNPESNKVKAPDAQPLDPVSAGPAPLGLQQASKEQGQNDTELKSPKVPGISVPEPKDPAKALPAKPNDGGAAKSLPPTKAIPPVKQGSDSEPSEPKPVTYSSSYSPEEGYENGLLSVAKNREHLVKKDSANKAWWGWAYQIFIKRKEKTLKNPVFKGVKDSFSESSNKTSLNQVCDSTYKEAYWGLKGSNSRLLNEVKKFCTPGKGAVNLELPVWHKPTHKKLMSDKGATNITGNLLTIPANKQKLLDPKKGENSEWFEWIFQKNFPKAEDRPKLPEPFKTVTFSYTSYSGTSLNLACKTAYEKSAAVLNTKSQYHNKTLIQLIKDYCSPDTITGNLEAPKN